MEKTGMNAGKTDDYPPAGGRAVQNILPEELSTAMDVLRDALLCITQGDMDMAEYLIGGKGKNRKDFCS